MPKQLERILSWYPGRNCWRKKYKGSTHYLATGGVCNGEQDQEGYLTAVSEWHAIKRRVDQGLPAKIEAAPVAVDARPEPRRPLDINLPTKTVAVAPFAYDYRTDPELPGELLAVSSDVTVDALVESFLAEYRQLAEMGERSISTFRGARDALADFQGYAKRHKVVQVNKVEPRRFSHFLKCYRDKQLELIAKGEHSAFTAKRRLLFVRRLIEWAYENEYLDTLPRKVNGNYAKVPLPDPQPIPFTLSEVKALWETATTKTKFSRKSNHNALYILLGLNLGYRSKDIATLKHEHLVEHEGRLLIVRKREKTGSPQIHRLWPLTEKLLREEMTDPAEHENVLLDERGGKLVVEFIDAKTSHTDCIGRCFNRLKEKLKWKGPNKGHSVLRDTTAQVLKDKGFPKHVIKQFLGHKERDVVRHYVTESIESHAELFAALDAIDAHYGLKMPE